MISQKDYCDYTTGHDLMMLGLEPGPYYDSCHSILLYDAQKFLREDKHIEVVVLGENEIGGPYYADIYTENGYAGYVRKSFDFYEDALAEGIKEVVNMLKNPELYENN